MGFKAYNCFKEEHENSVMVHNDRKNNNVLPFVEAANTDFDIVQGLVDKNPFAFELLVKKYGRSIDSHVWNFLGADDEHDDVVQKIFIRILRSIGKLKDPAALKAWIQRITVNELLKELRNRKYRRILFLVPDTDVYDVASQDNLIENRLHTKRVFAILNRFSPRDRIVFVMKYIEGSELIEIAQATTLSLATVKRHISRLRRKFLAKAERDPILSALVKEEDQL